MKALVKYVVFYPDNHQGGSGSHRDHKTLIELGDDLVLKDVKNIINNLLIIGLMDHILFHQ